MADNVSITPGSGAKAASREVAYSGETAQAQVVGLVTFAGADDAKTVADIGADNPLPVRLDQGAAGAISNGGSLQVDATQVNEVSGEALNAPNVALRGDEPVQMVGLHPSYPLPIDTATPMPIAGRDATGAQRQVSVNSAGAISTQSIDALGPFFIVYGTTLPSTTVLTLDTTGYSWVSIQVNSVGSFGGTLQFSNDNVNWFAARINYWDGSNITWTAGVISAISVQWAACLGRFMRIINIGTGNSLNCAVYLRGIASFPQIATSARIDFFGNTQASLTSGSVGVNAFGPTAPNAAHSTNNPVQMSGSDGTNVRRILTDSSGNTRVVGPLAAGTSLIPPTNAAFAPGLMGIADLEGRVQRATGDVRGRQAVTLPDATAADDGVIDALNNVVRELKLLNARIADLPYWLGVGAAMPDDASSFRDDPTIFNS